MNSMKGKHRGMVWKGQGTGVMVEEEEEKEQEEEEKEEEYKGIQRKSRQQQPWWAWHGCLCKNMNKLNE